MSPADAVPDELTGPGAYLTDPVHSDTYPAIDPSRTSLAGRSVFISGASKGIGRAMSLSFAKAGASQIAIAARSDMLTLAQELREAAAAAGKSSLAVLQVKLDVTSSESIDSAAALVAKEFGKLDILINNAGVVGNIVPVADSDPDEWWNTWTVNVRGPYLITRAFLPLMLRAGDKQIVNVSSVGAHVVNPGMSSYQPSKLALLRFTEFVSAEYSDKGVVTYSIHPGNVLTDLVTDLGSQISDELKKRM
ncbi:MAG: hypothetical protein Q9195_005373 [Heterodermia aff. obscurata]